MKCMRLSTLGAGIGFIIVIGFTITFIYTIKVLCDFSNLTDEDKRGNKDVWSSAITVLYIILVLCLVAIIMSGLLIAGIVKKRHVLMRPWLVCAFVGILLHGVRVIISLFRGFIYGANVSSVFVVFFTGALTFAIEFLIFFIIYKLYKSIRDANLMGTETEETAINTANDDPPSYGDLERNGQLNKYTIKNTI